MPPCGGVPYSSASRKNPKRDLASSSRHAEGAEDLALHVLPVDTDGARAQFGAVEHDVVGERAHSEPSGHRIDAPSAWPCLVRAAR